MIHLCWGEVLGGRGLVPLPTYCCAAESNPRQLPNDRALACRSHAAPWWGALLPSPALTLRLTALARCRSPLPLPERDTYNKALRSSGMECGRDRGKTAVGLLGFPNLALANGHSGPCHPACQGSLPATPADQHPAPPLANGGSLGSLEREQAPEPTLWHAAETGSTPQREHGSCGVRSNRA